MALDSKSTQQISVGRLLRIMWRRKFLIGFTVMLTLGASTVAVENLTPRYTAEVLLVLDVPQSKLGDMPVSTDNLAGRDTLVTRTQVDILQSPALAASVVRALSLVGDPEFNPTIRPLPVWMTWFQNATDWASNLTGYDLEAQLTSALHLSRPDSSPPDDDAQEHHVVAEFLRHLSVENDGKSYTLRVSFESTDGSKSAKIINQLADAYIESQIQAKYSAASRAVDWLASKLVDLRGKQRSAERAVQEFREKASVSEVYSGGAASPLAAIEILNLSRDLTDAGAARAKAEAESREAQALARVGGGSVSSSSTQISGPIQTLRTQLHTLQQRRASLLKTLGPNHPSAVALEADISETQAAIDREIGRIGETLSAQARIERTRESAIEHKMAALQAEYQKSNRASIELRHLEDEAAAARTVLNTFLIESLKTSAQIEIQQPDARIVARAETPQFASYPKKRVLLGTAVVAALMLSLLAVVVAESGERGLRNVEEIEQLFGIPVLGVIPSFLRRRKDASAPSRALANPRSLFAESVRAVGTVIHVARSPAKKKVVLITSALPREGKSTLASSLARISANSGQRVLVIDCDLRHPTISDHFELGASPGLAEVLDGSREPQEVVRATAASNIAVLPAGGTETAKIGIFDTERFEPLLRWASVEHDLIVLDCPPVGIVNDALLLARMSDAIILAVQWGTTPRALVGAALRKLGSANVQALGIVLTKVDIRQHVRRRFDHDSYFYFKGYVEG